MQWQAEKRHLGVQRLSPEQPRLPPGWGRTASTGSLRYIGPLPGVLIFSKAYYEIFRDFLQRFYKVTL